MKLYLAGMWAVLALTIIVWFLYELPHKAEDIVHAVAYIIASFSVVISIFVALHLALDE